MTVHATFSDLKDASVFISGGGSGIGAALTEGFLAQGAKVAFCDLLESSAFTAELAEKYGTAPLALQADVTDIPALQAALATAANAHGPITVLVNNAANDTRHQIDEVTPEAWDACQNVNLRHHFFAAQAVAPGMKQAGGGSIVNFSSITYLMGAGGLPGYVTAKAGVTGLTRALARDLGPDHIRVNAVLPGWVLTERQLRLWANPEALQSHLDRQCLPDRILPADMVEPVLFLASGSSRMVTGQALVVDGGVSVTG